jgi:hypothetical protein
MTPPAVVHVATFGVGCLAIKKAPTSTVKDASRSYQSGLDKSACQRPGELHRLSCEGYYMPPANDCQDSAGDPIRCNTSVIILFHFCNFPLV